MLCMHTQVTASRFPRVREQRAALIERGPCPAKKKTTPAWQSDAIGAVTHSSIVLHLIGCLRLQSGAEPCFAPARPACCSPSAVRSHLLVVLSVIDLKSIHRSTSSPPPPPSPSYPLTPLPVKGKCVRVCAWRAAHLQFTLFKNRPDSPGSPMLMCTTLHLFVCG